MEDFVLKSLGDFTSNLGEFIIFPCAGSLALTDHYGHNFKDATVCHAAFILNSVIHVRKRQNLH